MRKKRVLWILALTLFVVAAGILLFAPIQFVVGDSMEPVYHTGTVLVYDDSLAVARFDCIVFTRGASDRCVKRVYGLPGETITLAADGIYVNGVWLEDVYGSSTVFTAYSVKLGAGEYFVLGDNRASSVDSRSFGPVSEDRILGVCHAWFGARSRNFRKVEGVFIYGF